MTDDAEMRRRIAGIIDEDSPSFDAIIDALTRAPLIPEPDVERVSRYYRINGRPMLRDLTPREKQIVLYLSFGLGTKETALVLGVGDATVATHIANARHKLAAKTKTHLVAKAIRLGIIE